MTDTDYKFYNTEINRLTQDKQDLIAERNKQRLEIIKLESNGSCADRMFFAERTAHSDTRLWCRILFLCSILFMGFICILFKQYRNLQRETDTLRDNAIAAWYVKDLTGTYMAQADSLLSSVYSDNVSDTTVTVITDGAGNTYKLTVTKTK